MADVFTKSKRSEIMSKIRSKNTKLETYFCKLLSKTIYKDGYRFRKNYKKVLGCPDIAFPKYKIAVFIDGDFWHGYNFKLASSRLPKVYWQDKISGNMMRDKTVTKELRRQGWKVIRIWEHQVKKNPQISINKIINLLGTK